jgi:hypothetical protein
MKTYSKFSILIACSPFLVPNVFSQNDTLLIKGLSSIDYQDASHLLHRVEKSTTDIDSFFLKYNLTQTTNFKLTTKNNGTFRILTAYPNYSQTGIAANYSKIILADSANFTQLETYQTIWGIVSKSDSIYLVLAELNVPFRDIHSCCRVVNICLFNILNQSTKIVNGPFFFDCDNEIYDGFYDITEKVEAHEESNILYSGYGCFE